MKFRIQGAHKQTGDEMDFQIQAVDSKQAEKIAHERNIMISAVTAMPDEVNLDAIPMDEEPAAAPVAPATPAGAPAALPPEAAGSPPEVAGETYGDPDHPTTHMEYKLMQNQALYLLEKSVNKMILAGWEPQGGLTIAISNNAPNYFQALIRRPLAQHPAP